MTPREAKERFLRRRRNDSTTASVETYHGRLKLFVEWCDGVGIASVGDLYPYDINDYFDLRSGEAESTTVENEMYTLRKFCEFLETMGSVDDLSEKVPIPNVPEDERASDEKIPTDEALAAIRYHRENPETFGTRAHVLLELAWFTGARQGGLRVLDVRDVYQTENCVEFRHRPETDTPLKNKYYGERTVGVLEETMDAVAAFIRKHRYDIHDENGRQPLFASRYGRPTGNTFRVWSYLATLPCSYGSCPHGKSPETCEWTERNHASKCPSSRSPHPIRTGSVTWQLNSGVPIQDVSDRVNAEPKTIAAHYDKPDEEELWRRRREQMEHRRANLTNLSLTDD